MENKKLDEFNDYIKYRKIAVIGLGVSNIPLLDYLHEKKAKVTVFDQRTIDNISKELKSQINNEKDIVNEYINTNESEEYIEVEVIYEVLENIGTEEKIALWKDEENGRKKS